MPCSFSRDEHVRIQQFFENGIKYPDDPDSAVPPYYYERIGKCSLQVGNYILKDHRREYDYHEISWKYYELYLKYARFWKVPYHDKAAEENVKKLIGQFEEILKPIIKEQKRKNVWKKDVDSLKL